MEGTIKSPAAKVGKWLAGARVPHPDMAAVFYDFLSGAYTHTHSLPLLFFLHC